MLEESLLSTIHDAEDAIALTEENCKLINQRIPEIMELDKTEKDRVPDTVHIYFSFQKGEF